jgi:acyl dehydratase
MRLFTTGPLQFVGGAVGLAVDELRWPVAVRPGDRLQLTTEVLDARPSTSKPRFGILRISNVLTNHNSEVVLSYAASAMVQRRPQTPA